MLAVQARSLQAYYLYSESNEVQPQEFIGNRVAGILFENKIHHTTFFGNNLEYVHGIHMMPLLPHTPLIRTPDFVAEEWRALFSDGRAEAVEGGWKGILFGNYATIDPQGAYAFFSAPDFDPAWLDGGVSLTWYLCYSAGEWLLGNVVSSFVARPCPLTRVKRWVDCEGLFCSLPNFGFCLLPLLGKFCCEGKLVPEDRCGLDIRFPASALESRIVDRSWSSRIGVSKYLGYLLYVLDPSTSLRYPKRNFSQLPLLMQLVGKYFLVNAVLANRGIFFLYLFFFFGREPPGQTGSLK